MHGLPPHADVTRFRWLAQFNPIGHLLDWKNVVYPVIDHFQIIQRNSIAARHMGAFGSMRAFGSLKTFLEAELNPLFDAFKASDDFKSVSTATADSTDSMSLSLLDSKCQAADEDDGEEVPDDDRTSPSLAPPPFVASPALVHWSCSGRARHCPPRSPPARPPPTRTRTTCPPSSPVRGCRLCTSLYERRLAHPPVDERRLAHPRVR
jgi:hypothetical protein